MKNLIIPETFYRSQYTEKTVYRPTPPGALDLNRLTRAQAPFVANHASSIKIPKTLILSDWRLLVSISYKQSYNNYYLGYNQLDTHDGYTTPLLKSTWQHFQEHYFNLLQTLIDQGFEIKLIINEQLVDARAYLSNIGDLCNNMRFYSKNEIDQLFSTWNLNRDHALILGDNKETNELFRAAKIDTAMIQLSTWYLFRCCFFGQTTPLDPKSLIRKMKGDRKGEKIHLFHLAQKKENETQCREIAAYAKFVQDLQSDLSNDIKLIVDTVGVPNDNETAYTYQKHSNFYGLSIGISEKKGDIKKIIKQRKLDRKVLHTVLIYYDFSIALPGHSAASPTENDVKHLVLVNTNQYEENKETRRLNHDTLNQLLSCFPSIETLTLISGKIVALDKTAREPLATSAPAGLRKLDLSQISFSRLEDMRNLIEPFTSIETLLIYFNEPDSKALSLSRQNKVAFPDLRHLSISVRLFEEDLECESVQNFFSDLDISNVTNLSLSSYFARISAPPLMCPNLRRLNLGSFNFQTIQAFADYMAAFQSVSSLYFSPFYPLREDGATLPLRLPRLQYASISILSALYWAANSPTPYREYRPLAGGSPISTLTFSNAFSALGSSHSKVTRTEDYQASYRHNTVRELHGTIVFHASINPASRFEMLPYPIEESERRRIQALRGRQKLYFTEEDAIREFDRHDKMPTEIKKSFKELAIFLGHYPEARTLILEQSSNFHVGSEQLQEMIKSYFTQVDNFQKMGEIVDHDKVSLNMIHVQIGIILLLLLPIELPKVEKLNILIESDLDLKCICLLPSNFFRDLLRNNRQIKQVNFIVSNIRFTIHDDSYRHLVPALTTLEKFYGIQEVQLQSPNRTTTLSTTDSNKENESIYRAHVSQLREESSRYQIEKKAIIDEARKESKNETDPTPSSTDLTQEIKTEETLSDEELKYYHAHQLALDVLHSEDTETPSSESHAILRKFRASQRQRLNQNYSYQTFDELLRTIQAESPSTTKSILIYTQTNEESASLARALMKFNREGNTLYIHSPDDFSCPRGAIKFIDAGDAEMRSVISQEQGGALFHFLNDKESFNGKIIVCGDNFEELDIVKINTAFDPHPTIDGRSTADRQIIFIVNQYNPTAYHGTDFTSRFHKIFNSNFPAETIHNTASLSDFDESNENDSPTEEQTIINLYHENEPLPRLLGYWITNESGISYHSGELLTAIRERRPILIINPPLDKRALFACLDQLKREKKLFYNEQVFDFSDIDHLPDIRVLKKPNKTLRRAGDAFILATGTFSGQKIDFCLNPEVYYNFFTGFEQGADGILIQTEGHLGKSAKKELSIYVTHAITDGQWQRFFDACRKHEIKLRLFFSEQDILPTQLNLDTLSTDNAPNSFSINGLELIETNDPLQLVSEKSQIKNKSNPLCICVNESEPHDLIQKVTAHYHPERSNPFSIEIEPGLIPEAFKNNRPIILFGDFSKKLTQHLLAFFIETLPTLKIQRPDANITLISNNLDLFAHFRITQEPVSLPSNLLTQLTPSEYFERTVAQCQALLRHNKLKVKFPTILEPSSTPWDGLRSLSPKKFPSLIFKNAKTESDAFLRNRMALISAAYQQSPYVYLAGLTGTGKSNFIDTFTKTLKNTRCYYGVEQLLNWVRDPRPACLILDEENLTGKEWTNFFALFIARQNQNPSIVIENKEYLVNKDSHVIFAGNPANYSRERTLSPFFQQHGNCFVLDPLPPAVIYIEIIKPFLNSNQFNDSVCEKVARYFLEIYGFLIALSDNEVLITPREIKLFLTLTLSQYQLLSPQAKTDSNLINLAAYYAYQVGLELCPRLYRNEFISQFQNTPHPERESSSLFRIQNNETSFPFIVTPSRAKLLYTVIDFLHARHTEMASPRQVPNGAINTLVIEGLPGLGKSDLVSTVLDALGYQRRFPTDDRSRINNCIHYLYLPINLATHEKDNLLRWAFDRGLLVVIDEINAGSRMEHLMNNLLMGQTPEGKHATYPGFKIIATQNKGRVEASTALRRRMWTTELSPYEEKEILQILSSWGLGDYRFPLAGFFTAWNQTYPKQRMNIRDLQHLIKTEKAAEQPLLLTDGDMSSPAFSSQTPDVARHTIADTPPLFNFSKYENQISTQAMNDALRNLRVLLKDYKKHLMNETDEIAIQKREKITQLLKILKEGTNPPLHRLSEFKDELFDENYNIKQPFTLLLAHRKHFYTNTKFIVGIAIILGLAGLIPLAITAAILSMVSYKKTGSARFWKKAVTGEKILNASKTVIESIDQENPLPPKK